MNGKSVEGSKWSGITKKWLYVNRNDAKEKEGQTNPGKDGGEQTVVRSREKGKKKRAVADRREERCCRQRD